MARLPRYFIKDQPQHLIQRGNNREIIFVTDDDYVFYIECLFDAAKANGLKIHAYVLMTNHVHILASPTEESSIPKTLHSVGRRYVQYFNYHYDRTGTLWEGRYKATLIDSEDYLLTCMRYIEMNPVRAKDLAKHPKDYPWSSYCYNALGKSNKLITQHNIYTKLGKGEKERLSNYRQLFRQSLSNKILMDIRESTNKGWVLGGSRFKEKVETLTSRRTQPKPKGRPKNDKVETDPT